MSLPRTAGLLLHPTSLPGPYGIGDVGPSAHAWLDALAEAGIRTWQVLPLGPTGFGDSPYQCFSAFAGNPWLVSPEALAADGLVGSRDLEAHPRFSDDAVEFGPVIEWKLSLLDRAHAGFRAKAPRALTDAYEAFREESAGWLEDFALFMALKEAHGGAPWVEWDAPLARREPAALAATRTRLATSVDAQVFRQFVFHRQWQALRARARTHGIRVVGDVPIFVAHDSADVWAHPDLFELLPDGRPRVVAGVPPDYFSATGQLWGNPLYRWDAIAVDGYRWWIERVRAILALVDVARLDHFRGFVDYWEVPGDAPTAETGRWVAGPGEPLFAALRTALGGLPLIAEDLGEITPDVLDFRDRLGLPGMKILQFAFAKGGRDPFLPHRYPRNCVVYTGTHDNDTARGWYATAPEEQRDFARRYLGRDGSDFTWDLIRAAFASVADTAIVPLQDVLDLGADARMNLPGRAAGNWTWRVRDDAFGARERARLRDLATLYAR
jgi:4-alpha-glucanotransferase